MDFENYFQIVKNFNFSLSFHRFGEFTACLILMMYHHKRENIETTKPMKTQWKTAFLKDFKRISKAHLGALRSITNSVEFNDRWKKPTHLKHSVQACFLCICSITEHVNEKLSNPLVFHRFRKFLSKFQTHPNQCEFHKTYENPMDFATFNLHDQHGIKCVENKIQWGASNVLVFFNESEIQPN